MINLKHVWVNLGGYQYYFCTGCFHYGVFIDKVEMIVPFPGNWLVERVANSAK